MSKVFFLNGEHGKIYKKIEDIQDKLSIKIDKSHKESMKDISLIKENVASINTSLKFLPCKVNSNRLRVLEMRMYMALGGLTLLLLTKQLGFW